MSAKTGLQLLQEQESNLNVRDAIDIDKLELRKELSRKIISTFAIANLSVVIMSIIAIIVDQYNIHNGLSQGRIFTERVFLALIAATVAQLGAISFALSQWLFPKPN